jgi:hypothetical protein
MGQNNQIDKYYLIENVSGRINVLSETLYVPKKEPHQYVVKNLDKIPTYIPKPETIMSMESHWDISKIQPKDFEILKQAFEEKDYQTIFRIHNSNKLSEEHLCCGKGAGIVNKEMPWILANYQKKIN